MIANIKFSILFLFALTVGCSDEVQQEPELSVQPASDQVQKPKQEVKDTLNSNDDSPSLQGTNPNFTYTTFQNEDGSWGYQLLIDGKAIIIQKNIPAVPGIKGFATDEDAKTTAEFLLTKMKKGEIPPATSEKELQNLGVLNK